MKVRPEEITSILRKQIERYDVETDLAEVGTVLQIGDGIARIYGLDNCVALETATPFLASGRTDVIGEGVKMVRAVRDESGRASDNFAAGLRIAQALPEFRKAGLKPSV